MATRTIEFLGKAYADSGSVNVVATVGGTEVHNGPVPTINTARPEKNPSDNYEVLFTFEVDVTVQDTTVPSTIAVSGGDVIIVTYSANKMNKLDWNEQVVNLLPSIKQNIVIDSSSYTPVQDSGETGTFHILIEDGETASLDWDIRKAPQGCPGHVWEGTTYMYGDV